MFHLPFSGNRKRSSRTSPRPPFAARFRTLLLIPVYLLVAAAALATAFLIAEELRGFVAESTFFEIRNIDVAGASPALAAEIVASVEALKAHGRNNLLQFNVEEARFKIANMPRVRDARFRREFPQTLHVTVDERLPLLAANFRDLYWVDAEGVLIGRATPSEIAQAGVPVLTGLRGANAYAGMRLNQPRLRDVLETVALMAESDPDLVREFAEWNLSARDEVTGILRHGVEVRFGNAAPQEKLPLLETVLRRKPDLERYTYFDLRFDDQVVYF